MAETDHEISIRDILKKACEEGPHVNCVGGVGRDGKSCCDVWYELNPDHPRLGEKLVEAMEAQHFGDRLDSAEKQLIKDWPHHQLAAVVRAIQSVCAVHHEVDPCLMKKKLKGPQAVVILISERDPAAPGKKPPVLVEFQHPDFKPKSRPTPKSS